MENVKVVLKGTILTLEIDLKKPGHESASGKSLVVATTSGFASTGMEGVRFGLNVIRSKK